MNRSLNSFSRFVLVSVLAYSPRFAMAAAADSWKMEWEQTLSAAKKEGEISFYGSQGYEKIFENISQAISGNQSDLQHGSPRQRAWASRDV
jgi:hypothetical protein